MIRSALLLIACVILGAPALGASVYRCEGADGVQIFSDQPCENEPGVQPYLEPECLKLAAPRDLIADCFDLWRWMVLADPNTSVAGESWVIDRNGRRTVVVEALSGTPGSRTTTVYMQCPLDRDAIDRPRAVALAHRSLAEFQEGRSLQPPLCGEQRLNELAPQGAGSVHTGRWENGR